MRKINDIFKKIIKHDHFLPFILFTFIFTIYFCSSVGLINSGDTTQFFTAEAILKNKNLDLSPFSDNPYYFVYPDIYYKDGQTLNVRGYLTSVFMIPFHLLAHLIKNFLNTNNFPNEIKSDYFNYQLTVVSLFTFFSALGLIFIFLTLKKLTKHTLISVILIFFLAFGTYIWKYSAYYTRHGIMVFLFGVLIFYFLKKFKIFLLIFILTFGIEIFCFLSLLFSIIFIFLIFVKSKKIVLNFNNYFFNFIPAIFVFVIILYFNFYFYGNFLSMQVNQWWPIKNTLGDKANYFWFSGKIIPTIFCILFNFKKLPSIIFEHFKYYPKEIIIAGSVDFAQKYNFYGLFFISPFLLYSSFFNFYFKRELNRLIKIFITFCLITFLLGIIMISKTPFFWGGNQYDVRYFYPYVTLLAVPTALVLEKILKIKNKLIKNFFIFTFIISGIFSLVMGWLGVINMYKPALTGERKIWMEVYDLPNQLFNHSFKEYLDATFMNRENFWIPIVLSFIFYLFYRLVTFLVYFLQHKKHRG